MEPSKYRQQRCRHGWVDATQCEPCATARERDELRAALNELVRIYKREGAGKTSADEIDAAWRSAHSALRA
jgi:hypothetical protein